MSKSFPDQMATYFYIAKWILFAISTFVIVEEMASKQRRKVNFVVYSWSDAIVKGMQEEG